MHPLLFHLDQEPFLAKIQHGNLAIQLPFVGEMSPLQAQDDRGARLLRRESKFRPQQDKLTLQPSKLCACTTWDESLSALSCFSLKEGQTLRADF